MTYIKPQVIIHQEFSQPSTSDETIMRAMIVGPNANLHRYSDASEKTEIALGEYNTDPTDKKEFLYPERSPGGIVDKDYSKLYIDDALLCYYEDLTQTELGENATPGVLSATNQANLIKFNKNLVSHGVYHRDSAAFGSRDVQIGDYVWLQSYKGKGTKTEPCEYKEHLSRIIGFAPNEVPSSIGTVSASKITESTTSSEGITITAETDTVSNTVDNSKPYLVVTGTYDNLKSLEQSPDYTITVTGIRSTYNCAKSVTVDIVSTNKAGDTYRGLEIFLENEVVQGGESTTVPVYHFAIGDYGWEGKIYNVANLAVGDSWEVQQTFGYTVPALTVTGPYTGDVDDTYIIEFIQGGSYGNDNKAVGEAPKMMVRTALGLDYVAEVSIGEKNKAYACGCNGLSFAISGNVATGQGYVFEVTSSSNGAVQGIILQNDLPAEMRSTALKSVALNSRFFKKDNIVLKAENEVTPASPNFVQEDTKVTVSNNILLKDAEFGAAKTLKLFGGKMYFEYREWVQTFVNEVNYCDSITALDLIPGQLDPDNPLKYAVYKALANSNGVQVAFTAVANEKDENAWLAAFAAVEGTEDVYSVTPTTQDISILNQAATLIENESGAEQCRWKTGVFSIKTQTECMIVGQNKVNNELFETSTDGNYVLATFTDNPKEDGYQYTLVTVVSEDENGVKNAKFKTYDVQAGDSVRIIQADGTTVKTYLVDEVLSDDSLIVMGGPDEVLSTGQRIEIWHTMSRTEQAVYAGQLAASFANRRIMVVLPDKVGEDGVVLPGYYLAAAISGYKSGINAYQGMTRTEITGFDDFSATKPYWNEAQLNILADSGVCIVLEDANGTPYIRHALTTDRSSTAEQEESITRDYDYVCKTLYSVLQPYIGQANVTIELLETIDRAIQASLDSLVRSKHLTGYANLITSPHALLADRVEIRVMIALPFPINNIEVYIAA